MVDGLLMSICDTQPWPDDEDTTRETTVDIGEMPTLRWVRIAETAEPAPVTLSWGSGEPAESNRSSE